MRRVLWFALGAGSSVWARRSAKKRLERYTPPAAVERARQRGSAAARSVKAAVGEGRQAMRDYQTDAKADLDAQAARKRIRPARDA